MVRSVVQDLPTVLSVSGPLEVFDEWFPDLLVGGGGYLSPMERAVSTVPMNTPARKMIHSRWFFGMTSPKNENAPASSPVHRMSGQSHER
jgi:hypothetical protein